MCASVVTEFRYISYDCRGNDESGGRRNERYRARDGSFAVAGFFFICDTMDGGHDRRLRRAKHSAALYATRSQLFSHRAGERVGIGLVYIRYMKLFRVDTVAAAHIGDYGRAGSVAAFDYFELGSDSIRRVDYIVILREIKAVGRLR